MNVIQRLSRISLSLLFGAAFFLIVTPIGLILRVCRWDPLRRKPQTARSSWVPYPAPLLNPQHYERMS